MQGRLFRSPNKHFYNKGHIDNYTMMKKTKQNFLNVFFLLLIVSAVSSFKTRLRVKMRNNIFIYMITNTSTSTINNKCIFYSALPQH